MRNRREQWIETRRLALLPCLANLAGLGRSVGIVAAIMHCGNICHIADSGGFHRTVRLEHNHRREALEGDREAEDQ